MQLKFIHIGYGTATSIPALSWLRKQLYLVTDPGTASARYCYSVWLRHLVMVGSAGLDTAPRRVLELGPGNSIGIGLAALITGAESYCGLDMQSRAQPGRNLRVFDELVRLFQRRAPIPGPRAFPLLKPHLQSYAFPHHILTEDRLRQTLKPERIAELRALVASPSVDVDDRIGYLAPWSADEVMARHAGRVDMIVSQAVLEHVRDLPSTYSTLAALLRPGGIMSSQIDYKKHGTATAWNGHWGYTRDEWQRVLGDRPGFINRAPHSAHLRLMKQAGLTIALECPALRADGIDRQQLAPEFRALSAADLGCSGAYVLARKPDERRAVRPGGDKNAARSRT